MSMHAAITSQPAAPAGLLISQRDKFGYIPLNYLMEEVATRLKRHGFRGAITGPAGCGKTTMLQALGDELLAHGLSPLPLTIEPERSQPLPNDWQRTIRSARPTDALLLDNYDLLPRWARLWVLFASRRAGAVVVTAKRDVYFNTLAKPRPTPVLLEQIVARMLPATNLDIDARAMLEQCHGNLHAALDRVNEQAQG
ncbi:MAG: hypothetical protein AAF711_03925 [Planctomycetota bacterium]